MSVLKLALAVATLSCVSVSAFGATQVLGAWKGKIHVDIAKLPRANDPKMKPILLQQIAVVAKAAFDLKISKDGTFKMTVSGAPPPAKNETQTGTWSLKGDQLTLMSLHRKQSAHPFTIAKDGKSFSVDLPGGMAKLVFTR